MKRNLVAQCAAAVLTSAALVGANAAVVGPATNAAIDGTNVATGLTNNTDGIGHILIVPYYSAQSGNDTYLNIINHDVRNGKAVKVRFRGAANSDDVFDFTLLLSPGDVWAAAVTRDTATGKAKLVVTDTSCTLPNNVGKGDPARSNFVTARLDQTLSADALASGTREGYIEILNMADIYPGTVPAVGAAAPSHTGTLNINPLYTAVKHVNGTPPGCSETSTTMAALGVDPTDYNLTAGGAVQKGLDVPTGGLSASWTVINVPLASAFSGVADAVEARDAGGRPGWGNVVLSPQQPTAVPIASAREWTADPLLRGAVLTDNDLTGAPVKPANTNPTVPSYVQPAQFDFPDLSTPYIYADLATLGDGAATKRQAYRLSQSYAVTSVANEFVTDASVLAKTDWVFSLATRRYNVARNYGVSTYAGNTVSPAVPASTVYTSYRFDDAEGATGAPVNYFTPANSAQFTNGLICINGISTVGGQTNTTPILNRTSGITVDREENFLGASTSFVISPNTPTPGLSICGEVSVLTFNNSGGAGVLGGLVTKQDISPFPTNGWLRIATPGLAGQGLPIVGHSFVQITNGAASANVSGNYGVNFPHRNTRY